MSARAGMRWTRLRVALAVLTICVGLQVFAAHMLLLQRAEDTGGEFRFPLPDQVAAIATMIEQAAIDDEQQILRAVNAHDLRVVVLGADQERDAEDAIGRFPGLETVVQQYSEALKDRPVAVYTTAEDVHPSEQVRFRDRSLGSPYPLRFDISLSDGRVLRIETQGQLYRRVYGTPVGLFAGIFGVLVATLALVTIWRETKPLLNLSQRFDRFADAAEPELVPEEGPTEVKRLIAAFNRLQTRVAALLKARTAMLGAVSHDLRTYITRLRLRVENLPNAEQRAKAAADLDAMEAVIASTLALARSEAKAVHHAPVDLRRMLDAWVGAAPKPKPRLSIEASALIVSGDQVALERAVENLVRNAFLYAGGCEVRLGKLGDRAIIDVLDDGPGVPEEDLPRLLQPFERGDRARGQATPGTGLGLSIARNIAAAHQGELILQNRPGGGLKARITLPLAGQALADRAARPASKALAEV